MKNFILLFTLFSLSTTIAQETEDVFTVDVFIDSGAQVYLEDTPIQADNIEQEMSDHAFKNNAFNEDEVLYRIYADRNLDLGIIMNVNNQLIKAFHPSNTRTKRYLLDTNELDVNASNWQNSVRKLDLKALEN